MYFHLLLEYLYFPYVPLLSI